LIDAFDLALGFLQMLVECGGQGRVGGRARKLGQGLGQL